MNRYTQTGGQALSRRISVWAEPDFQGLGAQLCNERYGPIRVFPGDVFADLLDVRFCLQRNNNGDQRSALSSRWLLPRAGHCGIFLFQTIKNLLRGNTAMLFQ
jgi:hypothetical protein